MPLIVGTKSFSLCHVPEPYFNEKKNPELKFQRHVLLLGLGLQCMGDILLSLAEKENVMLSLFAMMRTMTTLLR